MFKTKKRFAMKIIAVVIAIAMIIGTIPYGTTTTFANNDGVVARIGDKEYASLEAALADVSAGNSNETPAEATVIELCQDTAHSFDVGTSNGTKPKNIELQLNGNTLTLKPAVGSTGTVSNGIRVLAYSKLTITNGDVVCSSEESDNVKVGIANYGELVLDGVNLQSGAFTLYTVNNRGNLTLKGKTVVENGQVAPNDYSDSTGLVAITNDPYDMYYSTRVDAVINCDSSDVVVGNIQIERYTQINRNEKGNNVLSISAGSFGSVIIPEESSDTGIDVVGNITGGSFEAASGTELQNVMDLTVAGTAYQTPEKAVSIKLTDDVENGFDVGNANGTAPKYFKLDLNGKTITLRPAVGSVGTVSSGIRVLAYSKLEISNGNVVCSDAAEDNIKVGIANYGTLGLDSVNVQSGALTIYTINNRGELTLSGATKVENAQVAQNDYANGSKYVAITNDPYTLYYTNDAVINCDSKDVVVGNIQLETYGSDGNVKLNVSAGYFGEIVAPTVSESDKVEIFGNITGGQYGNDVSEYLANGYRVSAENGTYTVSEKLVQDSFGFETPNPVDQWVGESYINKVTGVQGTGTTTYSVIAGEDVATVDATTGEVTFLKVGTVTIQANNTGDAQYLSATATYSVTSIKNSQDIFKFETTGPIEVEWEPNGIYQNVAIGGSGDGEVSYKILEDNGVATIDPGTGVVTFIKAGEVTVQAIKADDGKYLSTDTTYILKIKKIGQEELIIDSKKVITYSPDWQEAITVSGGSGEGKVKFEIPEEYAKYAEIDPEKGLIKTNRYGTIKVLISKEGDDNYNAVETTEVIIEIERAPQSNFDFVDETPTVIKYGENNNLYTIVATGGQTSEVPTYIIEGDAAEFDKNGNLIILKAGTVTITATKLGDERYDTVEAKHTLTIKHAQQNFAFEDGTEVSKTYGILEYTNKIIDEVGPGTITYKIVNGDEIGATIDEKTGVVTINDSELKVGKFTVSATKAGNECYEPKTLEYTLDLSYLEVENNIRAEISGETKNESGWYTGDVKFTAPDGYKISKSNALDNSNVWDDTVIFDTEGINDAIYYLRNTEGDITDAIVCDDVKIDKASPEKIEVAYSVSPEDITLELITFGLFKAKKVDVTITVADSISGIDTLTYDYGEGQKEIKADELSPEGSYKFTIAKDLRNIIEVKVNDVAGNTSTYENETIYVLDLTKPGFDVEYEHNSGSANIDKDIIYTQDATTFKFTITEENYDLAKAKGVMPVVTYDNIPASLEWIFDENTREVTASLTVSAKGDHIVTVEYVDLSGNEMVTYEKEIHIDDTDPIIDVTYYDYTGEQIEGDYKSDRTGKVEIAEHNFKAEKVDLTVDAKDINENPVDISEKYYSDYAKNPDNWKLVQSENGDVHILDMDGMKFDKDAIYHVELAYTDLAGNEAETYEADFIVDKTPAGNIKIEYKRNPLDEFIEKITDGFYRAPVTIIMTAEDEIAGVEYFELTYTKEVGASDDNTDTYKTEPIPAVQNMDENKKHIFTATYKLPAQAKGNISVDVMDKAGNSSKEADDKLIVVDDSEPTRTVKYSEAIVLDRVTMTPVDSYEERDDVILYYEEKTEVTLTIDEANFYKEDVIVSVTKDGVENAQVVDWTDESVDVHVGKFTLEGDGDYFVKVTYTDRSGNVMNEYTSQEIRIDNTDPTMSVSYSSDSKVANDEYYKEDRKAVITIVDHNFLADGVEVVVEAKNVQDINVENAEKIAKDYAEYLKNRDSWTPSEEIADAYIAEITFTEDAQYTFAISCEDIVGNQTTINEEPFVVDHKSPTDAIRVEYETPIIEKLISAVTFGFYKPSVTVKLTADDITSGVDYFEWTYNQEPDTSTEKNVDKQSGKISKDNITYSNDGKTATASFVLSADEAKQYRGSITYTATDRAGNTSNPYVDADDVVIVDTISPEISVTYTTENPETKVQYVDEQAFYNGEVKATIKIDEANFFEGIKTDKTEVKDSEVIHEVGILLEKTYEDGTSEKIEFLPEGSKQKYADASAQNIEWKKDGDTYSVDIPYDKDADYVLTVNYTDLSGNKAEDYTSNIITVDTTAPIVEVEYDNKNVINTIDGRQYFDAIQTAKITVEEHNFRADDFVATIVAEDVCGENVKVEDFAKTLATREKWNSSEDGNTHTIEIEYTVDANYTFDYTYADLAQNVAAEYEEDLFTVDQTAPENLEVTYSASLLENILETITFGYYNAEMTVTISAVDKTSGIHYFVPSYLKDEGVSDVNDELLNEVIKEASENIKQEGNKFTAEFKIPKLTLAGDNQFNGTVRFSAYDRAENNTEKVDDHRIVIDNINPTAEITYNQPVQNANDISYYAGDIEATVVINEANFHSEDVKITVTKDGNPVSINVKWEDNSVDVHTGTFTLTEDGDYIVNVEYMDRSANAMDSYTSNRLTLDTKAPTVQVTNIKNNSANKDEKYGFVITANDTNFNAESFKPVLTAVVRGENGTYSTKTISLGDMTTVESGKTYSYTINNLTEDAIYTLACSLEDMSGNAYTNIILDDGEEYDEVQFSINRNGSTFAVSESTEKLVNQYYVYSVEENVVIEEVNVDPIENYVVKLNGKTLNEGTDYKTSLSDKAGEWSKRTYTISKELFEEEGEYSIVVESTDKAETTAYSDVKNLNVSFVVDQTKPVVTISGLETSGRYQVEEQVVTIMPTDDGGRLNSVKVVLLDSDGKELSILFEMSKEELLNYLAENDGKITFKVPEGLENQVQIICNDCAVNAAGDTNEYNETYEKVTVSMSTWIIFYANKPLFYGSIAGVVALIAGIIILIVLKKRKKEENN